MMSKQVHPLFTAVTQVTPIAPPTGCGIRPVPNRNLVQMTSLRERPRLPSYFPSILSTFPIHVSWEPDQSYHVKMAPVGRNKERVCLMLQSLFVCRRLLTGGNVIPVSLIAVVPTVLEKSVFYEYLAVASCFPWATNTVCSLLFSSN